MTSKEIEIRLKEFYEGRSSLEDEQRLRELFISGNYPPEFSAEAAQFLFYDQERNSRLADPGFDQAMEKDIQKLQHFPFHPHRQRMFYISGIAAGILLLIGILFRFQGAFHPKNEPDSMNNPKVAYAEARKALMLLSVNLNTGLDNMQHLSHFEKGLKAMNHFSDFYKYQNLIINPNGNPVHKN